MTYLKYLFATTFTVLAITASINFFIDPANVYHADRLSAAAYAATLIKSEHGLWWPEDSLADRAVKKSLTNYSGQADCVVIGSSRVMQVGSARTKKSLENACPSILNLGVSGASIEDQFVLAYLSLRHGHPKKIVFGVDPWLFAFNKSPKWSYYAEDYKRARKEILGETKRGGAENNDILNSRLRNLLSIEYTIRSVQKIVSDLKNGPTSRFAEPAPELDERLGGKESVFFQDGSLQYSAKFLASAKTTPIPLGGVKYATDGILNDRVAIDEYISLLQWVKNQGVEPILLLTPYHQNVWKAPESPNARALIATEPVVRQIARKLDLKVMGTYNPDTAGCLDTEFLDFMHANTDCLAKLR